MAKKENHMGFMSKLLSFGSDKDLKRYYKIVDQINGLEPQFEKMTEEELRGQTDKFRERYANGESLDDMLPEAFATVREASKRTMGMRHFDVQLIGAMALHEGHIAEMKTGEGKTLGLHVGRLSQRYCRQGRSTSLLSMITLPSATPSGWAASTSTWA